MSPEDQLCQACPLEFSVRPVQLAPSGDGAPEDNKDEDLVRADAGLALRAGLFPRSVRPDG
jgi:hypothetical protein